MSRGVGIENLKDPPNSVILLFLLETHLLGGPPSRRQETWSELVGRTDPLCFFSGFAWSCADLGISRNLPDPPLRSLEGCTGHWPAVQLWVKQTRRQNNGEPVKGRDRRPQGGELPHSNVTKMKMGLEKTLLRIPLECKEIQSINSKGNQP